MSCFDSRLEAQVLAAAPAVKECCCGIAAGAQPFYDEEIRLVVCGYVR
jgi:hypothetical protein